MGLLVADAPFSQELGSAAQLQSDVLHDALTKLLPNIVHVRTGK